MPKISGMRDEVYRIEKPGKTYEFTKSYVGADPDDPQILISGKNTTVLMNGHATSVANFGAIQSTAAKVEIRIGADGVIDGDGVAARISGKQSVLINNGVLSGSDALYAVQFTQSAVGSRFVNNGKIDTAGDGVILDADGMTGINNRGARIASVDEPALIFDGEAGSRIAFTNHGTLRSGGGIAILGGDSDEILRSDGTIFGQIDMGAGNDVIDLRGGKFTGTIVSGTGNDVLVTDKAAFTLTESLNGGIDTVRSTVSYELTLYVENLVLLGKKNINGTGTIYADRLTGNAGNNTLTGYDGADILNGKGGNDILKGDTGADTFIFKTGYDKDRIVTFEVGFDSIDLSGWKAVKNFDDMIDNHAKNRGDDVWITHGKDKLIIERTSKEELVSSDFDF